MFSFSILANSTLKIFFESYFYGQKTETHHIIPKAGLPEKTIFAQAQYPDDFKEFGWIKYIHEHSAAHDNLLAKRMKMHGQKAINDHWQRPANR